MTLLAKQGWAFFQQGRMVAAMRLVTKRTILRGRSMFPQVRALFFSVAGVTGFIDRGLLKQKIIIAVMWIMAVAASHVSETQRMAAGFQGVSASLVVAPKTGFLLRQ